MANVNNRLLYSTEGPFRHTVKGNAFTAKQGLYSRKSELTELNALSPIVSDSIPVEPSQFILTVIGGFAERVRSLDFILIKVNSVWKSSPLG